MEETGKPEDAGKENETAAGGGARTAPEISCIVPVYNTEKYLRRCADSILAQTFRDFELILVDDGSPDGCGAICDGYAASDGRVRVIHKENGGVSSARNAGLAAARGVYVCFVDSDDWVEADYMLALRAAAEETGADMVVCGIRKQGKDGSFAELNFNKTCGNIVCKTRDEFLRIFVRLRAGPENATELHSPFNKLYRASLLNGVRFDEGVIMGEDYIFNLACFEKLESFALMPQCLYFYSFNENSACHTFNDNQFFGNICIITRTEEFFYKNGLDIKKFLPVKRDILYSCIIREFLALNSVFPDGKKDFCLVRRIQPYVDIGLILKSGLSFRKTAVFLLFKLRMYSLLDVLCMIYMRRRGSNI